MKILITCFDPFGNMEINASRAVLDRIDTYKFDAEIIKLEIPTVRYKSLEMIQKEIENCHPDVVIYLGLAGGRADITIERIGINVDDFRIEDNAGNKPQDEPIYQDGPDAYFSTLPVREIVNAINKHHIAASVSNTAGTFVCNHVLYGTRYYLEHHYPNIKSGFIHVPFIKEQGEPLHKPYMELEDIVKGIEITLETIISR